MKKRCNHLHKLLLIITFYHFSICSYSQIAFELKNEYDATFHILEEYLTTPSIGSFKNAVFETENVFSEKKISKDEFDEAILFLANNARRWAGANPQKNYRFSDSINLNFNFAIFKVLKDTIKIKLSDSIMIGVLPYNYDFNDFFGEQDWSNMFVTKLLSTHSGNCHSLPYLYKILADELGAKCWLSLAPNHMYIKNRCKSIGWYNTELTSGDFPIDAWIMASGYLPLQAIQNGIYMDTLGNQQAIALCVLDLAKGYEHQTHNYYDSFIIKCCDLSLQYFPKNVQAMLLKAETLKQVYLKQQKESPQKAKGTFNDMQDLYAKLFDLGYREMPDKMYMKWLRSVTEQKNKYSNKQLKQTLNGKTK
jgi:hypothetical protein